MGQTIGSGAPSIAGANPPPVPDRIPPDMPPQSSGPSLVGIPGITTGQNQPQPPGPSKANKLMTILTSGLQGALAGRAANEQATVQSGGRRSGGVGMGFEAGLSYPIQRATQEQQLRQAQAQTGLTQAETSNVNIPGVGQMPAWLARTMGPAWIRAQGQQGVANTQAQSREAVAGINKRFLTTPNGLFDTQTRQVIPDTGAGIPATQEIIKDFNLPPEYLGKPVKLSDFAQLERGQAMNVSTVQGSEGPALVTKAGPNAGQTTKLGLGSPAANPVALAQLSIAQGRLSLAQQSFERDTFGTLFGKEIPSSLVDSEGNILGWKSPSAPTQNIKTQAQQAQDLGDLFKTVRSKVREAEASGKLGPLSGRINEVMTGKIGADDPQFAELRALGSLTASGMLKAHFGARGGQQMYQHFEDLFNTGKMTAGDLLGAMDGFQTFMSQYANRVKTAAGNKTNPPPAQGGNVIRYNAQGQRVP